jgi:hypothetical protein
MTLDEAKAELLKQKAFLATQNMGRTDIEMMLAIIEEIEKLKETVERNRVSAVFAGNYK